MQRTDKITYSEDEIGDVSFQPDDYVVCPAHGVGRVISIETHTVGDSAIEMMVVKLEKDKMTLSIPVSKVGRAGVRKISSKDTVSKALGVLSGRAKEKRTMWSRRAIEYSQKINSGDLLSIAEVLRDLHRSDGQSESSYSEKQLYEVAFGRFVQEIAVAENMDENMVIHKIRSCLSGKQAA